VTANLSVNLDRWRDEFDELMLRIGAQFARVECNQSRPLLICGVLVLASGL
jgi:hypothetical protein